VFADLGAIAFGAAPAATSVAQRLIDQVLWSQHNIESGYFYTALRKEFHLNLCLEEGRCWPHRFH